MTKWRLFAEVPDRAPPLLYAQDGRGEVVLLDPALPPGQNWLSIRVSTDRAQPLYLLSRRTRLASPHQQQRQLVGGDGELMPGDQGRVVGPVQVVDDHRGGGCRAQLIHQRHEHFDARG